MHRSDLSGPRVPSGRVGKLEGDMLPIDLRPDWLDRIYYMYSFACSSAYDGLPGVANDHEKKKQPLLDDGSSPSCFEAAPITHPHPK